MVLPYFITSLLWMSIASVALMACPFFIGREM